MAGQQGTLTIRNKTGETILYQSNSYAYSYSSSSILGEELNRLNIGVTNVAYTIGGEAINNNTDMLTVYDSTAAGFNPLYDVTPGQSAETITGFFLDGQEYKIGGDEAAWGNISGTLSDQTDLNTALSGKQNTLSPQTAYTSKGSATKVPQITTNTLGQVTGITEVTITQPDISGKANTSDVLTKTNTTSYTPSADYHPATKKYVDDAVSSGSGGIQNDTTGTTTTVTKIRAGTEAEYALITHNVGTIYYIF